MLNVTFSNSNREGLQLLLLGAHCDDIEIGCGGTLLKLIENYQIKQVKWVVFTSNETRKKEAVSSAKEFLKPVRDSEIQIHNYKDGYLPSVWSNLKNEFEKIKNCYAPDVIFTHYKNDLHQDHRVINELTWNTFRNHAIFEYEIPKYDGDLGNPNFYVSLDKNQVKKKNKLILGNFESQREKHWFDDTLFASMMRIRGVECASASNYAEAFYSRKQVLQ